MRIGNAITAALLFVLGQAAAHAEDVPPVVEPASVASPTVVGRWEKVPLRLREITVTRIRVGPDKAIWVGTSDGLFVLQSLKSYQPRFANAGEMAR